MTEEEKLQRSLRKDRIVDMIGVPLLVIAGLAPIALLMWILWWVWPTMFVAGSIALATLLAILVWYMRD